MFFILLIVYLALALIGLVLLLIMAFTGGLLDMGLGDIDVDVDIGGDYETSAGPSPLSLPVILFTMTMTGAIGAVLTYFDALHWILNAAIAIGGAVFLAIIGFLIMAKVLSVMSANAVENINRLKGKTGLVTIPIMAGKEGQVVFSSKKTGRFTVGATSDKDIPSDTVVVVSEVIGDIVEVEPRDKKSTKGSGKKKDGKKKGGKKKK